MNEPEQEWMDRMTRWARETHSAVTGIESSVNAVNRGLEKLDGRVEKIADRLKDFDVYEKLARWSLPLLVVAAFTAAWSALELKAIVNRHSEQVAALDRATESLSKSISDLERSISHLSDLPKRIERIEDRLLRPDAGKLNPPAMSKSDQLEK